MLKSMPFLLFVLIALLSLVNPFLPLFVKEIMLAVSLTLKSGLLFLLPVLIFSLLFKTMVNLSDKATAAIGLILITVCCSNFTTTFLSQFAGQGIWHLNLAILQPDTTGGLTPAFNWQIPALFSNSVAMFTGIVLGMLGGRLARQQALRIAAGLERVGQSILVCFHYILPLFVAGFVVKLQQDGVISLLIRDYAPIFGIVALTQFGYIALLYFSLNGFRVTKTLQAIRHLLPAAVTGFSTMSSAAAMPLTIEGVAKNARDRDFARAIVPCTVNVHLLGDCIAIPLFAFALLKSFDMPAPTLFVWLSFTVYFVIAKFSVAAVPGGGILVMLPILENHLGFSAPMLSLITALYVLFDPIITSANILGNGAFARLMEKIMGLTHAPVSAFSDYSCSNEA